MEGNSFSKRKRISRLFFVIVGHVSLCMGLIGIAVPLLPTTPFLLLAAACYIRGSESLYNWLITQRVLGAYIASYREGRGIPMRLKFSLIALIWITIPLSAVLLLEHLYIRLTLLATALIVSTIVWRLPTTNQTGSKDAKTEVDE